jgi:hypothetical protein
MRGWAVAFCMLAGCYRPARPDCAVSCADGAPCPSGLTCGATDRLCHAGVIECSAMSFPPLDAAPGTDAPPGTDAAPGTDAGLAFCDPSQPGLIGCYEFENTANNALPGLDITVTNVTFPADGKVGRAAAFDGSTTATIAQDARLDLGAFTIETWINPSQTMMNNTSVVNHEFQYGMVLDTKGGPVCAYYTAPPGSQLVTAPPLGMTATPLKTDQWTHLACTFDGATLVLYVDGVAVVHADSNKPAATAVTPGVHIAGDPDLTKDVYVGRLDELRIFKVARTAHQICTDAGVAQCP